MSDDSWITLTDSLDEDGYVVRRVQLNRDGSLALEGWDSGPGVERYFGQSEYEFSRVYSAADTVELAKLLGCSSEQSLLNVIRERFRSHTEIEDFAAEHGIRGEFWSRVGD